MYKQLDLFGNAPEEKPVAPAKPEGSEEEKSYAALEEPEITLKEEPVVRSTAEYDTTSLFQETAPTEEINETIQPIDVQEPAVESEEKSLISVTHPPIAQSKAPEDATVTFLDTAEKYAEENSEPEPQSEIIVIAAPKKGKRGRKSQKEMEAEAAAIEIPPDDVLFKKQYYSIGEVSRMFKLNSSLLRYWESEFDIIKPRKNRKGDRHFRPEDIKNLYLIHHLLRARKYTIEGAKTYLKKNKNKASEQFEIIQKLEKVKLFLLELKAGL